jgi:shikimate kinase
MGASVQDRPLLAGDDPLATLTALLAAREPAYLQSNHTVSVELMTLEQVVDAIVPLARP